MAIQGLNRNDIWERMTPSSVRVAAGLANLQTEAEIARELRMTLNGVRSIVEALKSITGQRDVRAIGRFWSQHRNEWHAWCGVQAGIPD